MNTQQDTPVAKPDSSLFLEVVRQLKHSPLLIALTAVLTIALTITTIALSGEPYSATAVVSSRAAESRGFDVGSLASLTDLAGGGRRPIFEEFVHLLGSDAAARRLLAEKNPLTEALLERAKKQTLLRRSYYIVQNVMRTLAGRKPRHPVTFEDAVRQVRGAIQTRKTPEGYVTIEVSASYPNETKALLEGLVRISDELIRVRERAAYSERVSVLLSMAEKSTRPAERIAISSAIDRDFARYVSSLGSEAFAYQYVIPPRVATLPRYVNGVFVLMGWTLVSMLALVGFVLLRVRLRR